MPKPVESAAARRPLKQESRGREVLIRATISEPGSRLTTLTVGSYWTIQLQNDLLRQATGEDDL